MVLPPAAFAKPELVCPAGSLPALKAAVDHGADCVYAGFKDATNARNFAGLNFDHAHLAEGCRYAHAHGARMLIALNTYPQSDSWSVWTSAVDRAAGLGVDALILADPGLMAYAAKTHPQLALHLSVQASATTHEAINFYRERFAIRRAVLPRVLALAQIAQVIKNTDVDIEIFGFGGLCVMVEGRCALSAYATGTAPNSQGACSPGKAVRWQKNPKGLETRLNGILIDRYADDEKAGYPTLCKGRFNVADATYYAFEEPTSLNVLEILPDLMRLGIKAIKIEGRQRSPAYVAEVTRIWRAAIDACWASTAALGGKESKDWRAPPELLPSWQATLGKLAEGSTTTFGAYNRPWK